MQALCAMGFIHYAYHTFARPSDGVAHVVTDETLLDFVSNTSRQLVLFHSVNRKSQHLLPIFEDAAPFAKKKYGVSFASVDVTSAPRAVKQFGLHSCPRMVYFAYGAPFVSEVYVRSTSDRQGILEFLQGMHEDLVSETDTMAESMAMVSIMQSKVPLMLFFGAPHGKVYDAVTQIGNETRHLIPLIISKERRRRDPLIRAYCPNSQYQDFLEGWKRDAIQVWMDGIRCLDSVRSAENRQSLTDMWSVKIGSS